MRVDPQVLRLRRRTTSGRLAPRGRAGAARRRQVARQARGLPLHGRIDGLKRVAHASRQWMLDRSAGERSRLAQGFLEEGRRATDALQLGKEDKSLGAPGTRSSVRNEIGENRACARPLARATLGARRSERPTMPVAVGAWRRQPKRVLAEFGGDDGAPRVLASVAACSRSAATLSDPDSRSRARDDGPGRAGHSRSLRDVRAHDAARPPEHFGKARTRGAGA